MVHERSAPTSCSCCTTSPASCALDADRRAGCHGLTRAQWVILFWLDRQPGLSQKELAEILEVEPITVARLIDRLEERGMVERRADPGDRRVWRLHLLPPARPGAGRVARERAAMLAHATTGLTRTPSPRSPRRWRGMKCQCGGRAARPRRGHLTPQEVA